MNNAPKPHILISWVGNADLSGIPVNAKNTGPIDTLLESGQFSALHYLYTDDKSEEVKNFISILKKKHRALLREFNTGAMDPTDYQTILARVLEVADPFREGGRLGTVALNATSGTPAMGAVMLFLGINNNITVYATKKSTHAKSGTLIDCLTTPIEKVLRATLKWGAKTGGISDLVRKNLRVVQSSLSILLQGESGAGKSHLAREIHENSGLSGTFVVQSCAELSDDPNTAASILFGYVKGAFTGADTDTTGQLSAADGGTLFLDEVADLSPRMQAFLLRVLQQEWDEQTGTYGIRYNRFGQAAGKLGFKERARVRLITATNKNLLREVQAGRFRPDLYYRLAEYPLYISPFRELPRKDRERIATSLFFAIKKEQHSPVNLSDEAFERLVTHPWHGNIRQLNYTLRLLVALCEGSVIKLDAVDKVLGIPTPEEGHSTEQTIHFPSRIDEGFDVNTWVGRLQKHCASLALEQAGGNKTRAAHLLNVTAQTLNNYLGK